MQAELLRQLADYRAATPGEAEMWRRLRTFVEEHADCFERSLAEGHITGSAWVLDFDRTHVLLTHHSKLDKWLQLGGHADGEPDVLAVAVREAEEESGVPVRPIMREIFDVDVHLIPARGSEAEHYHYEVRFLLEADRSEPLRITSESKALAWVPVDQVESLTREESILRMVRKVLKHATSAAPTSRDRRGTRSKPGAR